MALVPLAPSISLRSGLMPSTAVSRLRWPSTALGLSRTLGMPASLPRRLLPFGLRPHMVLGVAQAADDLAPQFARAAVRRSRRRSPRATREGLIHMPFRPPRACVSPMLAPATSPEADNAGRFGEQRLVPRHEKPAEGQCPPCFLPGGGGARPARVPVAAGAYLGPGPCRASGRCRRRSAGCPKRRLGGGLSCDGRRAPMRVFGMLPGYPNLLGGPEVFGQNSNSPRLSK